MLKKDSRKPPNYSRILLIFLIMWVVVVFTLSWVVQRDEGSSAALVVAIKNRVEGESTNRISYFGPVMNSSSEESLSSMGATSSSCEIDGRKYMCLDVWRIIDEHDQEEIEISLRVGQEETEIPTIDVILETKYDIELRFDNSIGSQLKDLETNTPVSPPYIMKPGVYKLQWSGINGA